MLWASTNLGAKKEEKERGENSPATSHKIYDLADLIHGGDVVASGEGIIEVITVHW